VPTVQPITVPVLAGLLCCPCTDNAIIKGTPLADVPPAVTMAPSLQTFSMGPEQVHAPCVLPVCVDCRTRQLGVTSKTGLVVA
jgi:hypothetical protein